MLYIKYVYLNTKCTSGAPTDHLVYFQTIPLEKVGLTLDRLTLGLNICLNLKELGNLLL